MERMWRLTILYLCLYLLDCGIANTPDNNDDTADSSGYFQGDIMLSEEQQAALQSAALSGSHDAHVHRRSVVKLELKKWIDGVVPYELSSELSSAARSAALAAMNQYRMETCITFRPRNAFDIDYVYFNTDKGCYSYVGRYGGKQNISIGGNCQFKGVIMHEIFHALGRWHEQSRPDRDQYVRIIEANIESGRANNFDTVDITTTTTQGIPYDYDSIMHYDAYAFSINSSPTIQPLNDSVPLDRLGQRREFSEQDLQHVRELYCQGEASAEWSTWTSWSNCSSPCGEGVRTRERVCIGGQGRGCQGSSTETGSCNLGNCTTAARWGPWSAWTGCSQMCGGGRRTRLRVCGNRDKCEGESQEFEECNTQLCTPKWSVWSSWSECNQSCDGGMRNRSRACVGRREECLSVISPVYEYEECNTNVTCGDPVESAWSECSKSCGGGVQFKRVSDNEYRHRTCNEQVCHSELCLEGLTHLGCYKLPRSGLDTYMYESDSTDLHDQDQLAVNRTEPIRKCATAALEEGHSTFALAEGVCVSGSDKLEDYISDGESGICKEGIGGRFEEQLVIDVYLIENVPVFQASSNAAESCGMDYCTAEVVVCSGGARVTAPEVRTWLLLAFTALLEIIVCTVTVSF